MNAEIIGVFELNGEKFIKVQLENGSQMQLPFTEDLDQQLGFNWEELVAGETIQEVVEDANSRRTSEPVGGSRKFLNSSTNIGKKIWRKEEIKFLLHCYIGQKDKFENTCFENDAAWETISQTMKRNEFDDSANQCKFKFQQLKKKYTSAKDNNKKTGAAPIIFTFMEEFEELFFRDHAVCPVAVAESLQYTPMPSTSRAVLEENREDSQNEGETEDSPKRRLPVNRLLLEELQLYSEEKATRENERKEERNADREKRRRQREENISVTRQAMEIYKEMMGKLHKL